MEEVRINLANFIGYLFPSQSTEYCSTQTEVAMRATRAYVRATRFVNQWDLTTAEFEEALISAGFKVSEDKCNVLPHDLRVLIMICNVGILPELRAEIKRDIYFQAFFCKALRSFVEEENIEERTDGIIPAFTWQGKRYQFEIIQDRLVFNQCE